MQKSNKTTTFELEDDFREAFCRFRKIIGPTREISWERKADTLRPHSSQPERSAALASQDCFLAAET